MKPFDAETMGGLAIRIHSEPLPRPSEIIPGISPAVDAWFAKACARPASDRFTSAKELAESLAAALGGEMPRGVEMPRSTTSPNRVADAIAHAPTLATRTPASRPKRARFRRRARETASCCSARWAPCSRSGRSSASAT